MKRFAGLVLGLTIAAVLAWLAWRVPVPTHAPAMPAAVPADTLATGLKAVRLYFASPNGEGLVSESRELPTKPSGHVSGLDPAVATNPNWLPSRSA